MIKSSAVESWSDFYDEARYIKTLDSYLFRNPYKIITGNNHETETVFKYSMTPGENYIFEQKPIAKGITAYFGFDEVTKGIISLKTRLERDLDFSRDGIFENYISYKLKFALRKNGSSAWPKPEGEVTLCFYQEYIIEEKLKLQESEGFYLDCKDDADKHIKAQLKEYVLAYIQWVQDKHERLQEVEISNSEAITGNNIEGLVDLPFKLIKDDGNRKSPKLFLDYFIASELKDNYAKACKDVFGKQKRGKADAIMLCILTQEGHITIPNKGRNDFYIAWNIFLNSNIDINSLKKKSFAEINKYIDDVSPNGFSFKATDKNDIEYEQFKKVFINLLSSYIK